MIVADQVALQCVQDVGVNGELLSHANGYSNSQYSAYCGIFRLRSLCDSSFRIQVSSNGGHNMIKGVKFVSVPVRDQKTAVKFWTEKVGFKVLTDQQFDDKQHWIELGLPGQATGVVLFLMDGWEDRIG